MGDEFGLSTQMGGATGGRIDPNLLQNTGFYGTNLASLGGIQGYNQGYPGAGVNNNWGSNND